MQFFAAGKLAFLAPRQDWHKLNVHELSKILNGKGSARRQSRLDSQAYLLENPAKSQLRSE